MSSSDLNGMTFIALIHVVSLLCFHPDCVYVCVIWKNGLTESLDRYGRWLPNRRFPSP